MVSEIYSAGLISQSFWFLEFKRIVKLKSEGKNEDEIKVLCLEQNLFGAAKEYRAKRMFGYIMTRVKTLDDTMIDLFCTSDLETQKLINLVAILRCDRLFFEFIYEVYREKVSLGVLVIEDADVNVFFSYKESQSEDVASWTDGTKKRLRNSYFNFMTDANLLTVINKEKRITPPVLDIASIFHKTIVTIFFHYYLSIFLLSTIYNTFFQTSIL